MGNRAIIKPVNGSTGVYLHWNGGKNSVTAFLKYCELKEFRSFTDSYGIARFCQVVGNFFGGGLSLGIESDIEATEEYAEGIDNGIYIVDGWKIVDHIGSSYSDNYDLTEMLLEIDKRQPGKEQLGEAYIKAEEVDAKDLDLGDKVAVLDLEGHSEICEVVDFTADWKEGTLPVIDKYLNHAVINPNNILRGKVRRVRDDSDTNADKEN